jgi:WD40 repeat protein
MLDDSPAAELRAAYDANDWAHVLEVAQQMQPVPPADLARLITHAWQEVPVMVTAVPAHTFPITSVATTPDSHWAVSAGMDGALKLWDLAAARERHTFSNSSTVPSFALLTPDGRQVLSISALGGLRLWDRSSGRLLATLASTWPERLLKGGMADTIALITAERDAPRPRLLSRRMLHTMAFAWMMYREEITAAAIAPDGRRALTWSNDNQLSVWDLQKSRRIVRFPTAPHELNTLAWLPGQPRAVAGEPSGAITIWNVENGQVENTLKGRNQGVSDMALTRNAAQLLVQYVEGSVRLWDLHSGREVRTYDGPYKAGLRIVLAPDEQHVLSGMEDGTILLWALATGEVVRTLTGHTSMIQGLAVTADGRIIVSGDATGILRIWTFPTAILG